MAFFSLPQRLAALLLSPRAGGSRELPGPREESACLSDSPIMHCWSFCVSVPSLPWFQAKNLIAQELRGLGSYKNGSVTLQVKVSVNINCKTDTGKDLEHHLRTEVPILGERGLTAVSKPLGSVICFITHNLRVLKKRDPRQSGGTVGILAERIPASD